MTPPCTLEALHRSLDFLSSALLRAVYLGTGQLWIAMTLHALIDLNGILLQPALAARLERSR